VSIIPAVKVAPALVTQLGLLSLPCCERGSPDRKGGHPGMETGVPTVGVVLFRLMRT
jgi:hypothetical protein